MYTYCRLKDGRVMVVWSYDDEEFFVYPLNLKGNFDPTWMEPEKISASEVMVIDTNFLVVNKQARPEKA